MTDYRLHPEYVALLEAIRETPCDDAPRGIIADWLEEHGDDERAAFIREQLKNPEAAVRCPDTYCLPRRNPCGTGTPALPCRACLLALDDGLPPMLLGKARFDYSRGFASKLIALNRDQFLTHTPLLFNAFPLTRVNILSAIRDRDRRGVMGDLRWQLIRSELGAVLKDRLPAPKFSLRSLMGYYDGDSYEQLEAIVSNVCVTYGRERVGLPPLSQ